MCTPLAGASLDATLARWANEVVNPLAFVLVAMLADIVATTADGTEKMKAVCVLSKPLSFSALTLATTLLAYSHRMSFPAPGAGSVPITAQTLILCTNALLFDPTVSLCACGVYLCIGTMVVCLPPHAATRQLAPFGPTISSASGGYVFGFLPATALLVAQRQLAWPLSHAREPQLFLLLAWNVAACAMAQLVVLVCGAAWLAASRRAGLSVSVVPYIQGLVLKSLAAATVVVLIARRMGIHGDADGTAARSGWGCGQ